MQTQLSVVLCLSLPRPDGSKTGPCSAAPGEVNFGHFEVERVVCVLEGLSGVDC
jgi:hypothetical protein